jgi:hypothetical protein
VSAEITVTRSIDVPLDQLELITAEDMRELGLMIRERIIRRTQQGQGPDGPFAPLSDAYATRKREALGTAAPDLTVSGSMLNDITIVDVESDGLSARVRLGWVK